MSERICGPSKKPCVIGQDSDLGDSDCGGDVGQVKLPARVDEPLASRCGDLPTGLRVEDFHEPPRKVHGRNYERLYCPSSQSLM